MDNPAEYMLQFFNCEEREDGFDDNISKAFGQMHDTETCLNDLLSMNVRRLDTLKVSCPESGRNYGRHTPTHKGMVPWSVLT